MSNVKIITCHFGLIPFRSYFGRLNINPAYLLV
jgi:hypothetical protein